MSDDSLAHYKQLCLRIEQKFNEIRARHEAQFACRSGCHSCCRAGLTVGRLEKEALKVYLESKPALAEEARALEASNPHGGKRCKLLKANGDCLVYEARPIVCRSHGAPLQVKSLEHDEETIMRDVCPLNFRDLDITKLIPDDVLNVDTLNTLLALLTKRAFPKDTSRTALDVASLLK